MGFKAKKIVVDPSDPYGVDKVSRKDDVKNLSLLLRNISSPIVISVNAPWGSGKTTFLEMLSTDLRINDCNCVDFSAWETDFASDPLLAFLGEMNLQLDTLLNGDTKTSKAWAKAKKAGSHIVKKGIPTLIRVSTAGIITEKDVEGVVADFTESLSADLLEEYAKNKSIIVDFKKSISALLNDDSEDENHKLYIFVDELDRCRPTYAIEFLERVKHLLDIDGLVFIFAMDKEQLSHGVKGVYGQDFDAIGYLKRFIDIEYCLPEADIDSFIDHLYAMFEFDAFFESRKAIAAFQYEVPYLKDVFKFMASINQLSLREIEQFFSKLKLVIHATNERTCLHPVLLVFLLMIKESNKDLYLEYIQEGSSPEKMLELLHSFISDEQRYASHECALIESFLIAAKNDGYRETTGKTIDYYRTNIVDQSCGSELRRYSRRVVDLVGEAIGSGRYIQLDSIVFRIEMTENFIFHTDTAK